MAGIGYIAYRSFVTSLGILVGILSHHVAGSLTVTGIRWIYLIPEKGGKFHISGQFSTSITISVAHKSDSVFSDVRLLKSGGSLKYR